MHTTLRPPTPQWSHALQAADNQARARSQAAALQERAQQAEGENRQWHSVLMGAEAQLAALEESLQVVGGQ